MTGLVVLLLASACTEQQAVPSPISSTENAAACVSNITLGSAEIDALAQRFDDPDLPDPEATAGFVGLCEPAAFELAEQLEVRTFVLTRDGEEVGEPTLSFTNVVALVIVDEAVVEAFHQ